MNCPSCHTPLSPGDERCACGALVTPSVEGALAPDPRPRVEPLREIPGLRKRERTWKDEVRERVRDRRRQRAPGELPLFADAVDGPESETAASPDEAPAAAPAAAPAGVHAFADSRLGDVPEVPPARTLQLDDADEPLAVPPPAQAEEPEDLPLRPAAVTPLRGRASRAVVAPPPFGEEPAASAPAWDIGPAPTADTTAGELHAAVERPAYVIERFQAAVVDVVLLGGLSAIVVYFAGRVARVDVPSLLPAWPYLAAFLAFLALNYAAYFTGTTGQTLGKMLAGLRVVDAADGRTGYARALLRAGLGAIGAALLVGVVPMFLDPARRGLHDRLLGTRVVKH